MGQKYKVELPDGRAYEMEVPEGMTPEAAYESAKEHFTPTPLGERSTDRLIDQYANENNVLERAAKVIPGMAETGAYMATSIPSWLTGIGGQIGATAGALAHGKMPTRDDLDIAAQEATPQLFKDIVEEPQTVAGELGKRALGAGFEKAAEAVASPFVGAYTMTKGLRNGQNREQIQKEFKENLDTVTPLAMLGADVVGGALGVRHGVRAIREHREAGKLHKQAKEARAKLDAELDAKIDTEKAQLEIDKHDNTMLKYPDDLRAPQYGAGQNKKLTVPEDASLSDKARKQNAFRTAQERFDNDMKALDAEVERQFGEPSNIGADVRAIEAEKKAAEAKARQEIDQPMKFEPSRAAKPWDEVPIEKRIPRDPAEGGGYRLMEDSSWRRPYIHAAGRLDIASAAGPAEIHRALTDVVTGIKTIDVDPITRAKILGTDGMIDPISRLGLIDAWQKNPDVARLVKSANEQAAKLEALSARATDLKAEMSGTQGGRLPTNQAIYMQGIEEMRKTWDKGIESLKKTEANLLKVMEKISDNVQKRKPTYRLRKNKEGRVQVPVRDLLAIRRKPTNPLVESTLSGKELLAQKPKPQPKGQARESDVGPIVKTNTLPGHTMAMTRKGRKQGGWIDYQVVMEGVSALRKRLGDSKTFELFKGLYWGDSLKQAAKKHNMEGSKDKVVFMSPDMFHKLAASRLSGFDEVTPRKHKSIQTVVSGTKESLRDIPTLGLRLDYGPDGKPYFQTLGHEGRHRNDVIRDLGVDASPVILQFTTPEGLALWKEGKVRTVVGEDYLLPARKELAVWDELPDMADLSNVSDTRISTFTPQKGPAYIPKHQRGGATVDALAAIVSGPVASLVEKGIKRLKKPKGEPRPVSEKDHSPQAAARRAEGETRPPEEWAKSVPEEVLTTDIPEGYWNAALRNFTNASFLEHLTKDPKIGYAYNYIGNIVKIAQLKANILKQGTIFGKSHIAHLGKAADSPYSLWNSMSRGQKELLVDTINHYNGRARLNKEQLTAMGLDAKTIKAYDAFMDGIRLALDDVNALRPDAPINVLEGYFPKYRVGDFKLVAYDKAGNKVWADFYDTRLGRQLGKRAIEKELGAQFPDLTFKKESVDVKQRGNPYNINTFAFEELRNILGKNDPRTKALDSAIGEIKRRRGFGRHAIHRKDIRGGEVDINNFYNAFEGYVDAAYRYQSNLQVREFGKQMSAIKEMNAPRFKDWLSDYIDGVTGQFEYNKYVKGVQFVAEAITTAASLGQLGPSAPARIIRTANNWFMYKALFGYRPAFLIAQTLQPLQFTPQWLAHYQTLGYKGNILRASYDAEMMLLTGDAGLKTFISDYLLPRGGINQALMHTMDLFGHSHTNAATVLRHFTGQTIAQGIESFGRLQVAATAYAFFKQAGVKGKALHELAERATNDIMVDYSMQERPAWISEGGIIGTAAGPLSTFATNYWSTTTLFLQDILSNPGKAISYKPMAIHIAQTALWGGLTGMLGVASADAVIEFLRDIGMLDPHTQTVSEMILSNPDISDTVAFGPIGGATGMNLGGSMAAPEMKLPGANTFPGIKLMAEYMTTFVIPKLKEVFTNKAMTEQQKIQAAKTVLPNTLGGMLDVYEIRNVTDNMSGVTVRRREPGELIPDTNKRGFGKTRLDEKGQMARMLGTQSLDEVRLQRGLWGAQQKVEAENARKPGLLDRAADAWEGKSKQDFDAMLQEAIDLGIHPKQFMSALKQVLKMRQMTAYERATRAQRTPQQQRRAADIDAVRQNQP